MSRIGCFVAVDQATQRRFIDDPALIKEYICPDGVISSPPNSIDVDKAWQGIHFLLTGKAEGGDGPLALAALGGQEIGGEVVLGPARILTPDQVKTVAHALQRVDERSFRSKFAPEAMSEAGVYPAELWVSDRERVLTYLVQNYRRLVRFYEVAAARGDGVVQWLS